MKELTIEEMRRVELERRILKVQKKMAWRRAKNKMYQYQCTYPIGIIVLGVSYLLTVFGCITWQLLLIVLAFVTGQLISLHERWNFELEKENLK